MVEKYLHQSKMPPRRSFLLVDIRHEPSANDKQMYEWIRANGFSQLLSQQKPIKLSAASCRSRLNSKTGTGLGIKGNDVIIPFSALSKQGKEEIYARIDQILAADIPSAVQPAEERHEG